ncbi:hypothetical protein BBG10_05635 [Streptococcus dysgalactiae subsp. equisimilis]|nr:hypothetical protein BBG10_05635 [Streptococcus dysgalactiae subsp. equisimilis]
MGPDKFFCKRRYRTLDGDEVASSFKAKSKEELLDQQKPEIPQFVADWIEYCKKRALTLKGLFSNSDMPAKIFDWIFGSDENCRLMAEAWINGYTVEKEKLYTVEIPNPNDKQIAFRLKKWVDGKVIIIATHSSNNFTNDMLLTEQEIRKDFEWAWQFAKEVAE